MCATCCSGAHFCCYLLEGCTTQDDILIRYSAPVWSVCYYRPPVLGGSENFTILVKNHIMFPKFSVKRRNILDHMNGSYLANCRYHPVSDPLCPIFVLKDLLTLAGEDYKAISKRVSYFNPHRSNSRHDGLHSHPSSVACTNALSGFLSPGRRHGICDRYNPGITHPSIYSLKKIQLLIEWNCNLDMSTENCLPVYSFRRMDNKDDKLAKGWNFRWVTGR